MITNTDRLSLAAIALLASQVTFSEAFRFRRVSRASSSIDSSHSAGLVARNTEYEPCWSVIDLNPTKYDCKAAELAVNGTCQPLSFGDALESCAGACEPGQWCDDGSCEPIQIVLDPLHCGEDETVQLAPGEACVNGIPIPLDLTEDSFHCGAGADAKACDPGNYCHDGACTPITLGSETIVVGTDPYHCGPESEECAAGSLCVDGACEDIAIGQSLDNCKAEDLHPGTFCWESDIVPMHISTYPAACPEGELSISGVCFGDLPKTCAPQDGSGGAGAGSGSDGDSGSGSGAGSSSGSGSGSGSSSSGSPQYSGWFPDAGYGSVEHNGQWYNFGQPGSCGDTSCGPNSFCCSNTCLPLDGDQFEGCAGGCADGQFCWQNTCRPVYIGQPGGGTDGDYVFDCPCGDTQCGPNEVCIGGAVCVDLTPGNPDNCGTSGACPPYSLCLKDTCVPAGGGGGGGGDGGGGGGGGEPEVCDPFCANDETCIEGVCYSLGQPVECDPACEGDDACLYGVCVPPAGPGCSPACAPNSLCANGVCVPVVGPGVCNPACGDDESCVNGVCVPAAGPVCAPDCSATETCINGVCVPVVGPVTCDPACAPGSTCRDGTCVPVVGPVTCDPACGGDDTCVNGVCVPPVGPATCDPACDADETCVNGVCIPPAGPVCTPDCPPTDVCANGVCVPIVGPVTCDPACDANEACLNGVCIPSTPPDSCDPACAPGSTCVDGTCVPVVGPVTCDPACTGDDTCINGVCVPATGPDCNPECAATDACINGVCVPPVGPGTCDPACTGTDTCLNGVCIPATGPACDPLCAEDEVCANGVCVPTAPPSGCNPACGPGSICGPDDTCLPIIDPPTCNIGTGLGRRQEGSCPPGTTCAMGANGPECVPNPPGTCDTDFDCVGEEECVEGMCMILGQPDCDPECAAGDTCLNGVCVPPVGPECDPACQGTDTCLNGVCVPVGEPDCDPACTEGDTCINGVCVPPVGPDCDPACGADDTCVNGVCVPPGVVDCDPECPNDATCVNGVCIPLGLPCDPECTDGATCANGVCVPPIGPPTCDPECGGGQTCVQGVCVPATTSCDPACDEGETCTNGVCVPPPLACTPECSGDETCLNGVCIPESPDCDPACVSEDTCVNGVCVPPVGPDCDPACQGTDTCLNGVCVPLGTGCDPACEAGETCTLGVCVPPAPVCDPTCDSDETCINGVCVPGAVTCDPECEGDDTCVNGVCVPPAGPPACEPECGSEQTCILGVCVPDVIPPACNPDCDADETCVLGVCVPITLTCTPDCEEAETCVNGVCVPPTGPPICTPECQSDETCILGVCVPVLIVGCDPACSGLDTCLNGVCVPVTQPTCDPECDTDETCVLGVCVPATVAPPVCTPECGTGATCTNGVCVPDVPVCTPECDTDETCILGVCVPNEGPDVCDPVCEGGQICNNGVCVPLVPVCTPECETGETCVNGVCVPQSCSIFPVGRLARRQQGNCPPNFVCTGGICVPEVAPITCDPECEGDDTCVNGVCVPPVGPPTCDPPCNAAETCTNGVCVPQTCNIITVDVLTKRQQGDCPPNFTCTGGICVPEVPPLTCDPECEGDDTCTNGVCVPPVGPPTCDPECNAAETCTNGVCVPQTCTILTINRLARRQQGDCPPNFLCTGGICVPDDTPPSCTPECDIGETCTNGVCVPQSCTLPPVARSLAKRQQGDCPPNFLCTGGVCVPEETPSVCTPECATGQICTGGICVPQTCTLPVEISLTKRQQGDCPPGFICTPGAGDTNICLPESTGQQCGDAGVCDGGLICVNVDVLGAEVQACVSLRTCLPVGNLGCDPGQTCRVTIGLGGLTACVPTDSGNPDPVCTPPCSTGETCTAGADGPTCVADTVAPTNCGTGGACENGLICAEVDVLGANVEACVNLLTCIPLTNTGCPTDSTCRLTIGQNGLTACVPNGGTTPDPVCTPPCGTGETCTVGANGNACVADTVTQPTTCGDGGACTGGLICAEVDVLGANVEACVNILSCVPLTNTGCPTDSTCRVRIGTEGLTACVPNGGTTPDPVCTPPCGTGESCTAGADGPTCVPDTPTQPTTCGTGGACVGALICAEVDVLGANVEACVDPVECVPLTNTGCSAGSTCRLRIGTEGLTACVPDGGSTAPDPVCDPTCGEDETCTEGDNGPECVPNTAVVPGNCGTGGPCTNGLICAEIDVLGSTVEACVNLLTCVPIANTGCPTGQTCRATLNQNGLTACVPDGGSTTPDPVCTPPCGEGQTCTQGTDGPECVADTVVAPTTCGTGPACTGGLLCAEVQLVGSTVELCINPVSVPCVVGLNTGCPTGSTCRLTLNAGGVTTCIPNPPAAELVCTPPCDEGETCTEGDEGPVCTPDTIVAPTTCGTGPACTNGLVCAQVDVLGSTVSACVTLGECTLGLSGTAAGCAQGSTCRLTLNQGGLTACVPDSSTPPVTDPVCDPACGEDETCTEGADGPVCTPDGTSGPTPCGSGPACTGSLVCLEVDILGSTVEACIDPLPCTPGLNAGCPTGSTCRITLAGGVTGCVANTGAPPATDPVCDPVCEEDETCTEGEGGNTCVSNSVTPPGPTSCGSGPACTGSLVCLDVDILGSTVEACIDRLPCTPGLNTGCPTGSTCRITLAGGVTGCVANTGAPPATDPVCDPVCDEDETCTEGEDGNTCVPNSVTPPGPTSCGSGPACSGSLVCLDVNILGSTVETCIDPLPCTPGLNTGCPTGSTCRITLSGGITGCVAQGSTPPATGPVCSPTCEEDETCTEGEDGNTCVPNSVTPPGPTSCGSGPACSGAEVCLDVSLLGSTVEACVNVLTCIPGTTGSCPTGSTCRLTLNGGLTGCVAGVDTPPATGPVCSPTCGEDETCTEGEGGNTCVPNSTTPPGPTSCGGGAACSGAEVCADLDVAGATVQSCVNLVTCVPITNTGCPTGTVCRLRIGGGTLGACLPSSQTPNNNCGGSCTSSQTCNTQTNQCENNTPTPNNCGGSCTSSQTCNTQTNQCENNTPAPNNCGGSCTSSQTCNTQTNQCENNTPVDACGGCGSGLICLDLLGISTCVLPNRLCGLTNPCPSGFRCVAGLACTNLL